MDLFRRQLKRKILKYLGINILVSFLVLLFTFPFVSEEAGMEAYGFAMLAFIFHLVFLIVCWMIGLISLTIIPGSNKKSKLSVCITYLLFPIVWMFFLLYLSDFNINSYGNHLYSFITFFFGQIISLFLILKFLKKKNTENLPS